MRLFAQLHMFDFVRTKRLRLAFLIIFFCMLSSIISIPTYSASKTSVTIAELENMIPEYWLISNIQYEDVTIFLQEEPIVLDRDNLHNRVKFFIESKDEDLIEKWKFQIYDPLTLHSIFTFEGVAEELGQPLIWEFNSEHLDEYYCMFTVFYKDKTSAESKPYIFFIDRKSTYQNQLTTDNTEILDIEVALAKKSEETGLLSGEKITTEDCFAGIGSPPEIWLILDTQNDINIYIQEEPIVIDRHDLHNRIKLFFKSHCQNWITNWNFQIYDPVTLDLIFTFQGTFDDLNKPLVWEFNSELAEEYYCMFMVFYDDQISVQSKPYIFFIKKDTDGQLQEITDISLDLDFNLASDAEAQASEECDLISEADNKDINENETLITINDSELCQYFVVGFADLTLGNYELTNYIEPISESDEFKEGIYLDGHLAFYLEGKIKGKYLLTAQLDTGEKPISELFKNLNRKDKKFILDRIKSDQYYPIYGDDSTSKNEVDTLGKLYLKLEWDKSDLLWGNYRINLDETKISTYTRSLYGAKAHLESTEATKSGESRTNADIFWAEAQTLHSRDVIKATGGSLYYLKHSDIVTDSLEINVQIRDAYSEQIIESYPLEIGTDYKIDWLDGVVILYQDLASTVRDKFITYPSLDEKNVFLIADYEYEPFDEAIDNASYGIRTSHALSDNLSIGGSYIKETLLDGNEYQLYGIDGIYQFIPNSYLTLEWANSQKSLSGSFYSEDGGLNYIELPGVAEADTNQAYGLGLTMDLSNKVKNFTSLNLAFNYQVYDEGFASGKYLAQADSRQYQMEVTAEFANNYLLTSKYSYTTEEVKGNVTTAKVQMTKEYNDRFAGTLEVSYEDIFDAESDSISSDVLGAVRIDYLLNDQTAVYVRPQLSLNGSNPMQDNQLMLGTSTDINERTHLDLETIFSMSTQNVKFAGDYDLTPNNNVYAKIIFENRKTENDKAQFLVGHTGKVTDRLNMFIEQHLIKEGNDRTTSDVIGLNYLPSKNWTCYFDYTRSRVTEVETEITMRNLIRGGVEYESDEFKYNSDFRLKDQDKLTDIDEYYLTNSFYWDLDSEWDLLLDLNVAMTKSKVKNEEFEKLTEGIVGIAYRPIDNDRLNLFGKYLFVANSTPTEFFTEEEIYQIISLEGTYDLSDKWQLGEKLAYKLMKSLTTEDNWTVSGTYLWVNRLSYHLFNQWDISGEYRVLHTTLAEDTKSGILVAVYRYLNENTKLGIGYNFTDFSDNLTDLSYQAKGPFINFIVLW